METISHPTKMVILVLSRWETKYQAIVGVGDITMTTNTGCKLVLRDVIHVTNMRFNLISARKLDDVGLANYFGGGN